jgi:DNA polymerase-3 subunit gamma/tau
MSYQVLARKWRPRNFAALVGQEHVVRALVNALDRDRVHHAFLFTGTRGIGKTTVARIFAKALNCEQGVGSEPCGGCTACREIDEGRFVDLIEVDAASRTKVEDTRDLLDNVQYAPTRGRFKVYLVDEVHMLSNHSFNALLKTLEEPPPHVKFLLATTDPQKLPVTVLSRCLQFNLKRLPAELIAGQLERILGEEGIEYEAAAVKAVARAADGSMRDGLSLLDQAIAFGSGSVRAADVRTMLGTLDEEYLARMLRAVAAGDGAAVLEEVGRLAERAPDFAAALGALASMLQRVAIAQMVPTAVGEDWEQREAVVALAGAMTPEDVQLYYQIALNGRRDIPLAPEPRTGFEMVLLRMLAFRPAEAATPRPEAAPVPEAAPAPRESPASRPVVTGDRQRQAGGVAEPVPGDDWAGVVARLELKGMARELAANCSLLEREGNKLVLGIAPSHARIRSQVREQRLQEALEQLWGHPVQLRIEERDDAAETPAQRRDRAQADRLRQARASIENDANIRAMVETFGAEIVPDSVEPLD